MDERLREENVLILKAVISQQHGQIQQLLLQIQALQIQNQHQQAQMHFLQQQGLVSHQQQIHPPVAHFLSVSEYTSADSPSRHAFACCPISCHPKATGTLRQVQMAH